MAPLSSFMSRPPGRRATRSALRGDLAVELLADEVDVPRALREELLPNGGSAIDDHSLSARDDVADLQRVPTQDDEVRVPAFHEASLFVELEHPRRIGRHERKHEIERVPVLDDEAAELLPVDV